MAFGILVSGWWYQQSATFTRLFFVWLMTCWDISVSTSHICLYATLTIGLRCDATWNGLTYWVVWIVSTISPSLLIPWGPCTLCPFLTADVSLSRWIL